MKKIKLLTIAGLSVMAMASCKKEEINKAAQPAEKPAVTSGSEKSTNSVWGLGSDQRVYKWNGATWSEPNAAARMSTISACQDGSGSAWATGYTSKVYRWNGASWDEPNPSVTMMKIAAYSTSGAYSIGSVANNIYRTVDGGVSWSAIPKTGLPAKSNGAQGLLDITTSYGGMDIIGIGFDAKAYAYNPGTSTWTLISGSPQMLMISGVSPIIGDPVTNSKTWGIGCNSDGVIDYKVWAHVSFGSASWTQPNPAASLKFVSTSVENHVWGLGYDNRVYKWNGSSWSEPNAAARLVYISSGI
jgi:hypothetical protein